MKSLFTLVTKGLMILFLIFSIVIILIALISPDIIKSMIEWIK